MYNILLSLFILTYSGIVSAEILRDVVIIGNKRTTKESIIQHAQIKINQEFNDEELGNIKSNLGRISQIHIKNIIFKNGTLNIEMEDKWTLFPVPMITQSGNYYNRGFLIYNDNFLGSLGTLAPGISWSNSILNYLLYYQDESLLGPQCGIKILVMKKSDNVEYARSSAAVDLHESRFKSYLVTPNFLYKEQVFKAGPVFIDKEIYKNNLKIFSDKSQGLFFRHHWNAFQTMDVMYEGFVTTYDLYALNNQKGNFIYLNEANISWSIPISSSFLNFGIHGYQSSNDSYLFAKYLGGDEGFSGYDKASLPISLNFGALVQYQQHLFQTYFLSPFYEFNSSKLIQPVQAGRKLNENTIGVGIRYYFKKISIPAVIFDTARNIEDKTNHFHINIGVSI